MIRLIYPHVPYEPVAKKLKRVTQTGILTQGEYVKELESKLKKIVGSRYAFTTTSATTALHLSLAALQIGPGDEVLVANFTFPATGNVVVQVGATPVLVDITLPDYTINIQDLEKKITSRTKAIIPVDTFGFPCNMPEIIKIAKRHNLHVIEDAACAIGASIGGKRCGNFEGTGCFSFHPRKSITTGEGGLLTTNDKKIAKRVSILRNHGGVFNKQIGFYQFEMAGFNYRLSELQAIVGLSQITSLFPTINKRRKIAARYTKLFASKRPDVVTPKDQPGRKHTYQSYVVLLPKGSDRNSIIKKMKRHGIETTLGTYALHMQPYYQKKYKYHNNSLPQSTKAFTRALTLPLHDRLTLKDQEQIVSMLISFLPRL
ncbi:MAG: DegT/DnrJ/EryC1/StrS family aminotransferase [Patescibacteria group bacterium]|jgi:dTDP-4-amino-4,6-dideoxygalactose transaminase